MTDLTTRERLHFGPRNYATLAAALVSLTVGYVLLHGGFESLFAHWGRVDLNGGRNA